MLLLESSLEDELVVAVDGALGSQLGEEEGQQMLGLTMQPEKNKKDLVGIFSLQDISLHLCDFGEVDEGGLLGADPHHLRRPHHKLLLLA